MKDKGSTNPRLTEPKQPSMQRRAFHHDYRRPARYLITIAKSPAIPPLATIQGDPRCTDPSDAAIPRSTPLPPGSAINQALFRWQGKFPQITVDSHIIMPDHLHLCVRVTANLPYGLSLAIAGFKGLCTRIYRHTLSYRTAQALNSIALTLATLPPSTARFRPIPSTSTPSRPSPSCPE